MNLKRLDWVLLKAQDIELTPWEESFVRDMTRQRERYSDGVSVSERQEDVLERIAEKG